MLINEDIRSMAATNVVAQALIFTLVVCIPTWRTGRMSYVDIGWPLGLTFIGLVILFYAPVNTNRSMVIGIVYLFIGGRMALEAIKMWRQGEIDEELPRYAYQRIRWKKRGISNEALVKQVEVISQGMANMSFLAFPAFIIASNPNAPVHMLEIIGLALWLFAFLFEHTADLQKRRFIKRMKDKGLQNQVCNVGLWKYSRHPNYFAEWMVWNGLVLASIPSWFARYQSDALPIWILLGLGLVFVSRIMYVTLVHYTGAKPSEHYSAIKRPAYREYQATTNIFFPGQPKK